MMVTMSLEDARTIAWKLGCDCDAVVYVVRPRHHDFDFDVVWTDEPKFKLQVVQYWTAVTTIQRHLPVPLGYRTFEWCVHIGECWGALNHMAKYYVYKPKGKIK